MQSTRQESRPRVGKADGSTPPAVIAHPPKISSQQAIHRRQVKGSDVGIVGCVDGGRLLEWIYDAAHAVAGPWSDGRCVLASVGNVRLDRPVGAGELIELQACLTYTARRSMHILITIRSWHPAGHAAAQIAQCPMVFVAVDDNSEPIEVRAWIPVTMLELQRQRQARARIRMRQRIEDSMTAAVGTASDTAARTVLRFGAAATGVEDGPRLQCGQVMRWFDEAAYACGAGWTGAEVITSYVTGIRFCRPAVLGDVIEVAAHVLHTGPRSVHIGIRITSGGSCLGYGVAVVVSLDEHGAARSVEQFRPRTDVERLRDQHARQLIELRQFLEPFTTATHQG